MQETMRQLTQSLQARSSAPSRHNTAPSHRRCMTPPPLSNDQNSYSRSSRDMSYCLGVNSSIRSMDYYNDHSLTPERSSALEWLVRASPFDYLGLEQIEVFIGIHLDHVNIVSNTMREQLGLEQAFEDPCKPNKLLRKRF